MQDEDKTLVATAAGYLAAGAMFVTALVSTENAVHPYGMPVGLSSGLSVERPIAWAQIHPDDGSDNARKLIARAIVPAGADCPVAMVGDRRQTMQTRSPGQVFGFRITVCELVYEGHHAARIGAVELAPRRHHPQRIVVLGDTGCRIVHYQAPQACNDPTAWPFRQIVQAAKRLDPDLVIHVGDYQYREKPCSDPIACGNSPHGDVWETWQVDFFDPAADLLAAAPWIMLRGNHENCAREGAGWQLLLSPRPADSSIRALTCEDDQPPYEMRFADLRMLVFDTANAGDSYKRDERIQKYISWIRPLDQTVAPNAAGRSEETWLLLHEPLWSSYGKPKETDPFGAVAPDVDKAITDGGRLTDGLATAVKNDASAFGRALNVLKLWLRVHASRQLSPPISLVLSGDTHMFQFFAPEQPNLPVQVVAGMSGDMLEKKEDYEPILSATGQESELYGIKARLWAHLDYGFLLLTRGNSGWTATLYDVMGKPQLHCSLAAPRECRKA